MTELNMKNHRSEVATLGGGCFWCIKAVFQIIQGFEKVESGYAGGLVPNSTYTQVSTGAPQDTPKSHKSPSTPT
jgi:peptide methionine sulfoxide reductase MsrA